MIRRRSIEEFREFLQNVASISRESSTFSGLKKKSFKISLIFPPITLTQPFIFPWKNLSPEKYVSVLFEIIFTTMLWCQCNRCLDYIQRCFYVWLKHIYVLLIFMIFLYGKPRAASPETEPYKRWRMVLSLCGSPIIWYSLSFLNPSGLIDSDHLCAGVLIGS